MARSLEALLGATTDALRTYDDAALELLAAEAEVLAVAWQPGAFVSQGAGKLNRKGPVTPAARAAHSTLGALLESTSRSLRTLEQLRAAHAGGVVPGGGRSW